MLMGKQYDLFQATHNVKLVSCVLCCVCTTTHVAESGMFQVIMRNTYYIILFYYYYIQDIKKNDIFYNI